MRKVLMVLMALALVAVLPAQSLAQGYLVSYALHSQGRNVSFLRVLLDLDPRGVKKEGVPCGKIVSTPRT